MTDQTTTSEVLNRAADLIEERGWTQKGGWFPESAPADTPLCVEGALKVAAREFVAWPSSAYTDLHYHVLKPCLSAYLTDRSPQFFNPVAGHVIPFVWNDHHSRTQAEVIEVLRACAVVEASRERETAEVSA